jgi:putative membrane protein
MNDSSAGKQVGIRDIGWRDAPYIVGSGLCMGTADVVPGVSGGTMAVALGIYSRLLAAIASANAHFVRALARFDLRRALDILHWRFLTCLVGGIGLAVVVMIKVVKLPHLIDTQPMLVYAVFFGLVLASCFVLIRRISAWDAGKALLLLAGVAIGWGVVNLVPVSTPEDTGFVFLCGAVAICAMLLPGISGSFVLLILGKYEYVIDSLDALLHGDLGQLRVIVPFAIGCLVGLAAFARLLGWLLYKWHEPVLAFLTGLLLGTLWRIWPYQHLEKVEVRGKLKVIGAEPFMPGSFDVPVLLLVLAGLLAVVAIEWVAERRKTTTPA